MSCWAPEGRTCAILSFPCPTAGLARAAAGEGVGAPGEPRAALFSPQPQVGIPGLSLPPTLSILMHCCSCVGVVYLHEDFSLEVLMEHSRWLKTRRTPSLCSLWCSSLVFLAE